MIFIIKELKKCIAKFLLYFPQYYQYNIIKKHAQSNLPLYYQLNHFHQKPPTIFKPFSKKQKPIMNTLATQLSQQQNLQSFLIKTIQYLEKYFKTVTLQSEQKTYSSINKICLKIQSKFTNKYAIESLSKKLCLNIETKINDKEEDNESKSKENLQKKKSTSGMKSFITNIESAIQAESIEPSSPEFPPMQAPTRLPSTESEFSWIRKTVLEELQLLKDDITDADDKIDAHLQQALGRNHGSERCVLVFESFLNNKSIIEKIINLGWIPIIVRNQKKPSSAARTDATKEGGEGGKKQQQKGQQKESTKQILVTEISSYLHKCHSVIISSDSITKTGGVLCPSGSLMLCMMARRRKIPVIVISRNYCLSDKVLLNQKSLTTTINPSSYFKIDHNDFGLYITKDEDYIEGKYIELMITERGCWMVEEISHVQDQYWRY